MIQEQLKQAGITVELDQRTSDEFYAGDQAVDTPWLFTPANLVGWAGRAVPTQFIIPMVKTGAVWNGSKYANPALDAAADAYDATTDDAEKKKQAEIIADGAERRHADHHHRLGGGGPAVQQQQVDRHHGPPVGLRRLQRRRAGLRAVQRAWSIVGAACRRHRHHARR